MTNSAPPDWYRRGMPQVWLPYAQMKTARAPLAVSRTSGSRIVLSDGRVAERGSHVQLSRSRGPYQHMLQLTGS